MANYQSDWVFNLILKLAVVICLVTLSISLIVGSGPLTALLRSSTAFSVFALLGWATSLVWTAPESQEAAAKSEDSPADSKKKPAVGKQAEQDQQSPPKDS